MHPRLRVGLAPTAQLSILVFRYLNMSSRLQHLGSLRSCDGFVPVLAGLGDRVEDAGSIGLELAGLLGELEVGGQAGRTVVLRVGGEGEDLRWVDLAARWLAERGRRVVVRTPRVLPLAVVEALVRADATVLLELGHGRAELQRALWGSHASSLGSLLLQAQHLATLELPVAVWLGPLFPVVHAHRESMEALVRHVAAADVKRVHVSVGRLTARLAERLERVLESAQASALARVFGARSLAEISFDASGVRLPRLNAISVQQDALHIAHDAGLEHDPCGCSLACDAARPVSRPYESLVTRDLFAPMTR